MTKKKKKRRGPKGSRQYFVRGKTGKISCALCEMPLHGVPHGKTVAEIGKMSKTEKRPSTPFGGVLCGKCRKLAAEEKAKVDAKLKDIKSLDLRLRKFVMRGAAA